MKNFLIILVLGVVGLAVVAGILMATTYGIRVFSEATVSVTVITPVPGVLCAKLITSDGAAISCWKE